MFIFLVTAKLQSEKITSRAAIEMLMGCQRMSRGLSRLKIVWGILFSTLAIEEHDVLEC